MEIPLHEAQPQPHGIPPRQAAQGDERRPPQEHLPQLTVAHAEGLEQAVKEALTWPGVYYVRVWLNEGVLNVGDSLMYVLIGADIRPRCIDALQQLVGKIKNELVVEKEIYA